MTTENFKSGNHEIDLQKLHHNLVMTVDGQELDIPVVDAIEFYEKLGKTLGIVPGITLWDGPTH